MRLPPRMGSRGLRTQMLLACLATAVACGDGGSPELSGLGDQVGQVGTELKIDLNGTDPEGDRLAYRFRTASTLPGLEDRTSLTVSPSGAGVFRWTPTGADVGEHAFDFTASDGDHDTTVTITIDVRSAIGAATAPIFRQPLGSGTTMNLALRKCLELAIVVDDQDTTEVALAMEEPLIEGATLTRTGGAAATFSWCPTKEQEAETRRTLVLSADDRDNPKTIKNYLLVLRGGSTTGCPGTAPVITHTPKNETTIVGLTVDAQVTDDKGLKSTPLFYYAMAPPGTPPDLSQMIQLDTLEIDGTPTNGVYAADVPNPVAALPAGSAQTLYYVFVADDDDDVTGNCDHSTMSPVYQMTVTSSGAANQPICATCTTDAQCGTGDLCVSMGSMGASYCLQGCAGGCPTGYACSASPLSSVDGKAAAQCVPQSGSCQTPSSSCVDDANEDDDTRAQASANAAADGPLGVGLYDFVSCPKVNPPTSGSQVDDDWFQLVTTADTRVDLWLYGDDESDLDLHLYRSDGTVLTKSTSLEADENIVRCLPAGTYYVKVNGYDAVRSEYLLDQLTAPQACVTTCTDDVREDDDTYSQARQVTTATYTQAGNVTCPNDDDWYKVRLTTGKRLKLDLTFTQSNSSQDLDFHLYKGEFNDLWPCSPASSSTCSIAHGQGGTSNEHAEYTVPAGCEAGCDYYVVVRGYNGSTNSYGITIAVQ